MSEPQDPNRPGQQPLNIELDEQIAEGIYSNLVMIAHSAEEFILDFINMVPPQGVVTARIVTSPGHLKRLILNTGTHIDVILKHPLNGQF